MEDFGLDFIIKNMRWSFSRINSFYSNCKKAWKEQYIDCAPTINSFDGQVGSVAHSTFEAFFKGEITEFDMSSYFTELYKKEVTMACPYPSGDTKYEKILDYFNNFTFDFDKYEILGVEKRVDFKVGDYDCVGFIDLLYRNKETGEITLMDHKSSTIKTLRNGKISKSDQEHFLAFCRQQYLYSKVVMEEYGRVDYLKWNMFKDGTEIEIPWKEDEYKDTFEWALNTIVAIENETEYPPNPNWYYCSNLCGVRSNGTCPYKRLGMIYDGIKSKCCNPKSKQYAEYGGIGITLYDEWANDKHEFFKWALENGYEDGLVLKRYDESEGYDFFNCYWGEREMSEESEYYNPEG